MKNAYYKDIRRSIKKGWKRFLSICLITALGVGMLTGLYAACFDMYYAADQFYDRQNLFDIRILSTLGLTQEDVDALAGVDGVETAEGGYSKTVYTDINGVRKSAEMTVLSSKGLNTPFLLAGFMPAIKGEIAVTQKYMDESGKSIGDILTIQDKDADSVQADTEIAHEDSGFAMDIDPELEKPVFANTMYTITGVILDPMNIESNGSGSAFRSASATDYSFFMPEAGADNDNFTVVYLALSGTKEMNSYSNEYEKAVQFIINNLEGHTRTQREQARYDAIVKEGRSKLEDAEAAMHQKFAEADETFTNAWRDIAEAKQKLADGETALAREQEDANQTIAEARTKLDDGKKKLAEAEKQLAEGEAQLAKAKAELDENAQKLEESKQIFTDERQKTESQLAAAERQVQEAQGHLEEARTQLEADIARLKMFFGGAWPANEWDALVNAAANLAAAGADDSAIVSGTAAESAALANLLPGQSEAGVQAALAMGKIIGAQQVLDAQKVALAGQKETALYQMAQAEAELAAGEAKIEAARRMLASEEAKLSAGKAELAEKRDELTNGEAKLRAEEAEAWKKIADAVDEIAEKKQELADGEAELLEKEREYAGKKEEARQKIADSYVKLEDIDRARWYIQDRASLESYSNLDSDLSSIEAIGRVFPVIFLLVAVLMSLTAMTRMVEEERGLIGTYKALGFGSAAIYGKYLLFAFAACLFGGFLGDLLGFVFLPKVISAMLKELYALPQVDLRFDFLYGVGGVLLFMVAIIGATAFACHGELVQMPAALLRPKAPRAGARVSLERLPAVWNRLKFLNKVTIRNLFRYKKRLFMTIGGIMGCTALILCGFAIRDSVSILSPRQYGYIYQYDLLAVFEEKENDTLVKRLASDDMVAEILNVRIESVKLINADGKEAKVQLLVLPGGNAAENYIRLEILYGKPARLDDGGVLITQNAARILHLKAGDAVSLQNGELNQREAFVSGTIQNYLGNTVYMTQALYESLFGAYAPNGVLAHLSDLCTDQSAYAEALLDNDSVLSAVSTTALREDFKFDLIYAVVLILIAMAGGLAFVVLFTLSNTNISERVRELATVKVLGFYNKEVYQYIHKETLILTAAGILVGLPAGRVLSGFLTAALNMPDIHFAVHIKPVSYLLAAGITACFAVAVNWITNRTLDRISMVEALKNVE